MGNIDQAQRDVEAGVKRLLALGERAAGTATVVEQEVWAASLGLGRAVMALFFARRAEQPRRVQYKHEGRRYKLVGHERTQVGTRFGKVTLRQPVGEVTDPTYNTAPRRR